MYVRCKKMQFTTLIQGVVISRLVGCSASSGNDGPALENIAIGPTYRLPDLCLYLHLCACDIAIGAFCPHRLLDLCLYLCLFACACDIAFGATSLIPDLSLCLSSQPLVPASGLHALFAASNHFQMSPHYRGQLTGC